MAGKHLDGKQNTPSVAHHDAAVRRRVRLLMLLDAAEGAGLTPLRVLRLHAFAFLSNVLAPVWSLLPLDGRILKRRGGPFYPSLQRDLDRLVGMGMVVVSSLGHVRDEGRRWRLEGAYELNRALAVRALQALHGYEDEERVRSFIQELAYGLSALSDDDFDDAVSEDATYSDPLVTDGNVVDFGEWKTTNLSADAATLFARVMPGGVSPTPGERVHLYVRHLHRRMRASG